MAVPPLRLWRSPYSNFQKDDALNASRVYTNGHLQEIARAGFNAIWVHGLLHELVPSTVFPEFGRNSVSQLASLRTVIRRAALIGMKVYLYMQPPRGFRADAGFWRRHPEARGAEYVHAGVPMIAMCTSEPKVMAFLRESATTLSRRLAGLGGVILITASEYVGHCYTKYNYLGRRKMGMPPGAPLGCPRCESRHPADVVLEIIRAFHAAFREAGNGAEVIAWQWAGICTIRHLTNES